MRRPWRRRPGSAKTPAVRRQAPSRPQEVSLQCSDCGPQSECSSVGLQHLKTQPDRDRW